MALRIKYELDRSQEPQDFAISIGFKKTNGTVTKMMDREIVDTIIVCGRRRILKTSKKKALKYLAGREERMIANLMKFCGVNDSGGHRWKKKEASEAAKISHKNRNELLKKAKRASGFVDLMTACEITGMDSARIKTLCICGDLPCKIVNREYHFKRSDIETLALKKGKKS